MLKKEIKYEDYNGTTRTDTFYFNITEAELMDMEMDHEEGFEAYMMKVINAANKKELYDAFKDLIMLSYGVKSEDGRRHEKSEDISKAFAQSPAYSELLIEFLTVPGAVQEFVHGVLPDEKKLEDISAKAEALSKENAVKPGQAPISGVRPAQ